MDTKSNLTAAIYTRISSDPDGTALGVARQEADCRALCSVRGWTVGRVYQDNDLSAYKSTVVRPAFQAMLNAAEAGTVGAIVAYHLDRLTRQTLEMATLIDLTERKGLMIATCSGDVDPSTTSGRLMMQIMGGVARAASEDTARRIKRKKLELAAAGKFGGGGRRAYGYAADRLTVVEDEAQIIREMVRRVIEGDTITGIAADLEHRGIQTVGGKFGWRPSTIKQLVQSGRIAGRREALGVDIAEAEWPAVVDLKDVERVRSILAERPRTARTVRKYALGGLVFCLTCGAPMRGAGLHHGQRRYACVKDQGTEGRCAKTFIQADGLERYIRDDAMGRLLQMTDYGTKGAAVANAAEIEVRLAKNQRKLGQLVRDYAASTDYPAADFEAARADLKAQNDRDRAALSAQTPQSAALSELWHPWASGLQGSQKAWDMLEPARQRSIFGLVYDKILVGPGRPGRRPKGRFPAERVSMIYADGTTAEVRPGPYVRSYSALELRASTDRLSRRRQKDPTEDAP